MFDDDPEDAESRVDVNPLVVTKLDELLKQPFDKALQMCPELQKHIATQEDPKDVEREFRQAWAPDGSRELRDVLYQVLDPKAAAHNAAAAEAILKGQRSLLDEPMPAGGSSD